MVQAKSGQREGPPGGKLVFFHKGQWVTTTVALAQGMEVEHPAVIQRVRAQQADLEKFGDIVFEAPPDEPRGGPGEYALLNRHHAVALLLGYPAEMDIVREFAARLLRVFLEMSERFSVEPATGEARAQGVLTALDVVEQVLTRFFPERAERLLLMAWIMNTLADRLDNLATRRDSEPGGEQAGQKNRSLH